jgi:hypothetical protein
MQGPNAVLNTITLPPGATKTQARLVLDGVRGAIFLYQNGGPTGALIGSWARSAGTDPYGNNYPQGFNVSVGTISGTTFLGTNFEIDSTGAFFYTGTPAAGNAPILAISTAAVDPFGNSIRPGDALPGGPFIILGPIPAGGAHSFIELATSTLEVALGTGDVGEFGPGTAVATVNGGGASRAFGISIGSPSVNGGFDGQVVLLSTSFDLTSSGAVGILGSTSGNQLLAGDRPNHSPQLQWQDTRTWGIDRSQVDAAQHVHTNNTVFAPLTALFNVDANDSVANTVYEIETEGVGVFENQTLAWTIKLDGTQQLAGGATIGAGFFGVGVNFNWWVKWKVRVEGGGTTVAISMMGGVSINGTESSGANNNNAALVGTIGTGIAWNRAVAHTLEGGSAFGGSTVGQSITSDGSELTRKGP